MTGDEATLAIIDTLEALQVPYMLVGSLSSNVYGVSRSTKGADFVIQVGDLSVRTIADRLGPSFRLDPQMSFDTVTLSTRHVLEVVGTSFQIELFHLSDDPHYPEWFRRRVRIKASNRDLSLPTVEDVIITNLRWTEGGRRTRTTGTFVKTPGERFAAPGPPDSLTSDSSLSDFA